MGQGQAFLCRDPDGHMIELYYDTEWYQPPPEQKPALKNQAQRFPGRGCNVRRLDHLNALRSTSRPTGCSSKTISASGHRTDHPRRRHRSRDGDDDVEQDLQLRLYPRPPAAGRLHHITFALDSREEIFHAADIFLENGIHIKTGRTSTRSSRHSSCMSMSPAATASKSPTPAPASFSRLTGSRWCGPRRNARRDRRGG